MSGVALVLLLIAVSAVLFSIGIFMGMWYADRSAGKGANLDQELIRRWCSLTRKIDELTHRNATGLCSVRERLERLTELTREQRLVDVNSHVQDVIENNHRLQGQIDDLQRSLRESHEREGNRPATPRATVREADAFGSYGTTFEPQPSERAEDADRFAQFLDRFARRVANGTPLEDQLNFIYEEFHLFVPFRRIGYAEVDDDGQTVVSRWARSDRPCRLEVDYSAPLTGSSLQFVATQQRPRVLDNLIEYLASRPHSKSTRLIVAEGFRSSLTCPLIAGGRCVGFLFFTSDQTNAFCDRHVEMAKQVAGQLGTKRVVPAAYKSAVST